MEVAAGTGITVGAAIFIDDQNWLSREQAI